MNVEILHELIAVLLAIGNFAKDIHYSCKGEASYSKHLLADRVEDDIYDFIDSIKETCILATYNETKPSTEYLSMAIKIIPTKTNSDHENFKSLMSLLLRGRRLCNDICSDGSFEAGITNLVGNIAEYLMNQSGVLYLQIKPEQIQDPVMQESEDDDHEDSVFNYDKLDDMRNRIDDARKV